MACERFIVLLLHLVELGLPAVEANFLDASRSNDLYSSAWSNRAIFDITLQFNKRPGLRDLRLVDDASWEVSFAHERCGLQEVGSSRRRTVLHFLELLHDFSVLVSLVGVMGQISLVLVLAYVLFIVEHSDGNVSHGFRVFILDQFTRWLFSDS